MFVKLKKTRYARYFNTIYKFIKYVSSLIKIYLSKFLELYLKCLTGFPKMYSQTTNIKY